MSYEPPQPPRRSARSARWSSTSRSGSRLLIRDEIELAKAEITEKAQRLPRGGVVGIVAGTFAFLGLILLMHSIAWLLNDLFFGDHFWVGFLIEAVAFARTAAIAGYVAHHAVQKGSPPTPDLAIEEGRRIKQTLEAGTTPAAKEPVTPSGQEPVTPHAQPPVTPPTQEPAP